MRTWQDGDADGPLAATFSGHGQEDRKGKAMDEPIQFHFLSFI